LKEHFNSCSDCQKKLLLYKRLGEVVASSSSNPIPEGFEKAIVERLRGARQIRLINDVIVTAVASIGIILIGLIVFMTPQLKYTVTKYLTDAWHYGREFTTIAEGTDIMTFLAFGAALLILFTAIDQLTLGRLRSATSPRGCSETD
jgi:hypothetical protein